jgi:hypothetical protein
VLTTRGGIVTENPQFLERRAEENLGQPGFTGPRPIFAIALEDPERVLATQDGLGKETLRE